MSKKSLLISGLIVLIGGFFIFEKFTATQQNTTPVITPQQTPTSGNNNPPQQTPAQTTTGLKDGTYLGDQTSSIYGNAQAEIIVSGGQITDVQFPQYPQGRMASMMKSNEAMTMIKQEVIQAQSANVNTVSGATETSASFIQSIASAIAKAV